MMTPPPQSPDLHGNVPDKCAVALLLIDVIFTYPGGERLLHHALEMAPAIARLKSRASEHGVPAIYVNDNFGRWQSDLRRLLEHALGPDAAGPEFVRQVAPDEDDYFVLKPKHSGFYSTTLEILLSYLGATTVIVTGIATNSCVLFTAADAFLRDLHIFVPRDCTVAIDPRDHEYALEQMGDLLGADTAPSDELDLAALVGRSLAAGPSHDAGEGRA